MREKRRMKKRRERSRGRRKYSEGSYMLGSLRGQISITINEKVQVDARVRYCKSSTQMAKLCGREVRKQKGMGIQMKLQAYTHTNTRKHIYMFFGSYMYLLQVYVYIGVTVCSKGRWRVGDVGWRPRVGVVDRPYPPLLFQSSCRALTFIPGRPAKAKRTRTNSAAAFKRTKGNPRRRSNLSTPYF